MDKATEITPCREGQCLPCGCHCIKLEPIKVGSLRSGGRPWHLQVGAESHHSSIGERTSSDTDFLHYHVSFAQPSTGQTWTLSISPGYVGLLALDRVVPPREGRFSYFRSSVILRTPQVTSSWTFLITQPQMAELKPKSDTSRGMQALLQQNTVNKAQARDIVNKYAIQSGPSEPTSEFFHLTRGSAKHSVDAQAGYPGQQSEDSGLPNLRYVD